MAVIVTKNLSTLKLYLSKGTDPETNKEIKTTKAFGYVDSAAADQNVFDVANALVGLQKYDLLNIKRVNSSTLSE